MFDRSRELDSSRHYAIDELDEDDIELGLGGISEETTQKNPFYNSFFSEVGSIKGKIQLIEENTTDLEKLYNKYIATVKTSPIIKELKEQINHIRRENGKKIDEVKDFLLDVAKKNQEMEIRDKKESGGKSAELRIRENQFMDVMKRFQKVQADHKEQHREDLKRYVKIAANNKLEDAEAEEIIDSPNFNEETFLQEQIMKTTAASTAKTVYNEMKETRDELLKLEESMSELAEMFRDMYNLVLLQQDLVDNIQQSVNHASDYVEKSVENMKTAVKYQKKGNCTGSIIIVLVICIVLVVVILLLIAMAVLFGLNIIPIRSL